MSTRMSTRTQLRLLTTAEAAESLALSRRTLEAYRLRSVGPAYVRVGMSSRGPVRYREADLVAWAEAQVVSGAAR